MTDETRVLPHDIGAEQAVLGAILANPAQFEKVAERLKPADFMRRGHQVVFKAMGILDGRREPIDLLTVKAELTRTGDLEEAGGPAYISAMMDGVPRSVNAAHYALIVRDHAIRRRTIAYGKAMASAAYDGELPVDELLRRADTGVLGLQTGSGIGELTDLRATSDALFADLEYRAQNRGKLHGIPTGFPSIDQLTNGWQRGNLVVLAARPSIGKSAFVLNTLAASAAAGFVGVLFSLEMKRREIEYRLLSSLSGVPLSRILGGYLNDDEYAALSPAFEALHKLPIYVNDRSVVTVWEIRAACRRLKAERGALDLVIVDYIQLMRGNGDRRYENRTTEVTEISRSLKVLADELEVPMLVLSQLNRGAEGRADKRPILSDLRESGALEQDADIVGFLHRAHHRENGRTDFILEKARNSETGTVTLHIDRNIQRFTDGGLEAEQPSLPPAEPVADDRPKPPKHWNRTRR